MKKKMIALLAGLMLTLSAGSAFAAFADLNLTRIAYGTTNEVATDLGSVSSLLAAGSSTLSTGTSNLVAMGAGATGPGSSVYVMYYATDATKLWFTAANTGIGSTIAVDKTNGVAAAGALSAAGFGISTTYASLPAVTDSINPNVVSAVGTIASPGSYFASFEGGGQPGTSTLASAVPALVDAQLTAAVTQGLFYWDGTSGQAVEVATITTNLNGSSTISATPIPAAAYLLGSGLMGLFGLRRKNKV